MLVTVRVTTILGYFTGENIGKNTRENTGENTNTRANTSENTREDIRENTCEAQRKYLFALTVAPVKLPLHPSFLVFHYVTK